MIRIFARAAGVAVLLGAGVLLGTPAYAAPNGGPIMLECWWDGESTSTWNSSMKDPHLAPMSAGGIAIAVLCVPGRGPTRFPIDWIQPNVDGALAGG